MSQTTIGQIHLASGLRQFQEFTQHGNLKAARSVIDKKDSDPEKLYAAIPKDVARLALLMRTPVIWDAMISSLPDRVREELVSAKKFADEHLSGIEVHPGLMRSVREPVSKPEGQNSDANPLTEFSNFNTSPLWFQVEASLVPILAISIRDRKEKLLLRVCVDWDDLSFLVSCAVQALCSELKRVDDLGKLAPIDIPYGEIVVERIREMEAAVAEIRVLATKLELSKSGLSGSSEKSKARAQGETVVM